VADTVLQSFVIRMRYEFDEAAAKKFRDSIGNSVTQLNAFRLSVLGAIVGIEELVRRTTTGMGALSNAARSANVSAREMEEFRARMVGMGHSAEEAAGLLDDMFARLRDPQQREAIKGFLNGGKDVANGAEALRLAIEKYRKAYEAAGGNEQALSMITATQEIEAAIGKQGLAFARGQVIFRKEVEETRKATEDALASVTRNTKVSIDDMYRASAAMERQFWVLGNTMRLVFGEFIANPATSQAIQDLTTAFSTWLISDETQQAFRDIIQGLTKFFSDKATRDSFKNDLIAIKDAVLAIAHAINWLWGLFKDTFGDKWGTVALVAMIAFRKTILGLVVRLGAAMASAMFAPIIEAAAPAAAAVSAAFSAALAGLGAFGVGVGAGVAIDQFTPWGGWMDSLMEKIFGNKTGIELSDKQKGRGRHFQQGGIVNANLHHGEMVLPANISAGLQGFFSGGGGSFVETSRRLLQSFLGWFAGDTSYKPQVDLSDTTLEKMGFHPNEQTASGAGGGVPTTTTGGAYPQVTPNGPPGPPASGGGQWFTGVGGPHEAEFGGFNFAGLKKGFGPDANKFRMYPNEYAGAADAMRLLMSNLYTGGDANTVRKILYRWAPPGDQRGNFPELLRRAQEAFPGASIDAPLDLKNPETMLKLMDLMQRNEFGGKRHVEMPKLQEYVKRFLGGENTPPGAPSAAPGSSVPGALPSSGTVSSSRGQKITGQLNAMLTKIGDQFGVRFDVTSGVRLGGHGRHDPRTSGLGAADVRIYDAKTGRMLDPTNPADFDRLGKIAEEAYRSGASGIGAGHGYMGGQELHIGGPSSHAGGAPYWGTGERAAGAMPWLVQAYKRSQELRAAMAPANQYRPAQYAGQQQPTVVQHVTYNVNESHSPGATAKQIKYTQDRSLAALQRNNRVYMA